jgi:hypothetical protein
VPVFVPAISIGVARGCFLKRSTFRPPHKQPLYRIGLRVPLAHSHFNAIVSGYILQGKRVGVFAAVSKLGREVWSRASGCVSIFSRSGSSTACLAYGEGPHPLPRPPPSESERLAFSPSAKGSK